MTDEGLRFDRSGLAVEYAVKMIQLDRNLSAGALLREERLSKSDICQVADRVAEFHTTAATSPDITLLGDLSTVKRNVKENFRQTLPYIDISVARELYDDLDAYSMAFLETKESLFHARAREGRIKDGHGDLHLENIFLQNGIKIIDCIEFNDRFRCLDVSEDIAFTAMDLDFYGREDLSRLFVEHYVERTNDQGALELLDFFKVYRAHVRGKVFSFRLDDPDLGRGQFREVTSEASRYFRLAHGYVQKTYSRPLLILVTGLMGTGKSRIASELSQRWGLDLISSDATRKQLAGLRVHEHRYEGYGKGIYSSEFSQRTYRQMFDRSSDILSEGGSVVLDATFGNRAMRQDILEVGSRLGAKSFVIECQLPEGEVKARLERRMEDPGTAISDGRWELYPEQRSNWQPIEKLPRDCHIPLDTSLPPERTLPVLLKTLFCRLIRGVESEPQSQANGATEAPKGDPTPLESR